MASNLDEIRRELHQWRGRLHNRRVAQAQARRRLARTRRLVHNALRRVHRLERQARAHAPAGARAALDWCAHHLYITEQPPGSNCDNRIDGIRTWMHRLGFGCGVPWCGIFVGNALLHAGVRGVSSRIAAVALIEADARASQGPFNGWGAAGSARPGDLVVLFGYGVHVEIVRAVGNGFLDCYGGNTGNGESLPTRRYFNQVRGIAHVRY